LGPAAGRRAAAAVAPAKRRAAPGDDLPQRGAEGASDAVGASAIAELRAGKRPRRRRGVK